MKSTNNGMRPLLMSWAQDMGDEVLLWAQTWLQQKKHIYSLLKFTSLAMLISTYSCSSRPLESKRVAPPS